MRSSSDTKDSKGTTFSHKQVLANASAEMVSHAMELAWRRVYPAISLLPEYCRNIIHLTTADRASSNLKLEGALSSRARETENEARIWYPCLTHLLSTIACHQYSLVKDAITGCVSFALSQRAAGALGKLRAGLECLIEARVVVTREPTSEFFDPGKQWRETMLDLLFPLASTDHPLAKQEAASVKIISKLLNGDWKERRIVHHCCCDLPCEPSEFARTLASTLLPHATPLFPRHRWTGADKTLRAILLLAPHNMLADLVPVWLDAVTKKTQPTVEQFSLSTPSMAQDS